MKVDRKEKMTVDIFMKLSQARMEFRYEFCHSNDYFNPIICFSKMLVIFQYFKKSICFISIKS